MINRGFLHAKCTLNYMSIPRFRGSPSSHAMDYRFSEYSKMGGFFFSTKIIVARKYSEQQKFLPSGTLAIDFIRSDSHPQRIITEESLHLKSTESVEFSCFIYTVFLFVVF